MNFKKIWIIARHEYINNLKRPGFIIWTLAVPALAGIGLLIVTFAVQGAFVGFFLYLRKRAKLIADIDLDNEWSELQGGASRT